MNGGDDDLVFMGIAPAVLILQLPLQYGGGGVAVGRTLFKAVVFLHGLIIQVLAVYHKENLLDVGQPGSNLRRFKGGQGLAAAGGMPDISATRNGSIGFVVVRNLQPAQNAFCCGNLVGAHDQQHVFRRENTVPGQKIQQRVLGEKGLCKINQIRDDTILRIRPKRGKLKAVAGFGLGAFPGSSRLPDMVEAGAVGIVFGIGAIGNDENLHVLKEPGGCPEAFPLIAVDLMKRLPNGDAPALKLYMHHGQAVDQHRYIITVFMDSFRGRVLIDDL